jgi:hypothetical protein
MQCEITSEHLLIPFNDNSKHSVQNTNLVPNTVENIDIASDNGSTTCTNETDVREFGSNFDLDHSEMDDSQIQHLETKSPLDKIYLLEVHAPCFPNKIFEGSLPQTIVLWSFSSNTHSLFLVQRTFH